MVRRNLDIDLVYGILAAPEQWFEVGPGRVVLLLVDIERRPPEVITVYRSSKIWKYWKHMP
ncbi:MAG: hypothetical protein IIA55_15845 [Gemmatimonadetes bacterium]|nr:hypothetical protein [Gemmatimonadota bacterium]